MHISSSKALARGGFLLAAILLGCFPAAAQTAGGSVSGTVQDSQGAVIPGATVRLTNTAQGAASARDLTTSAEGTFVFSPVPPGTYSIEVASAGFKKYAQSGITLDVNQQLGLPAITLDVGATNESVTVEANAVQLETVTAERSGVVNGSQMVDIALNGRNFTGLMRTVAGATGDGTNDFNGQRSDQMNYTVDGQTVIDTGINGIDTQRINVDSISEFKVSDNSQSAEFGRNSGAQVQVVIKSGTREFHGAGWWFHRNEGLNANTFINNESGIQRQLYRFMTAGFNIGGPIYIPGVFNRNKDKLFLFGSNEWNHSKTPGTLQQITVPTALERQGNFSQTKDGSGIPVTITNPNAGGTPFPGNIIPPSLFNPIGVKILDFFPMPNTTGNPLYNYQSQVTSSTPQYDQIYKLDYNISDKWRFFIRGLRNISTTVTPYGTLTSQNVLGLSPLTNPTGGWSLAADLTTIISPTFTNEFLFGKTLNYIPANPPPANSPYLTSVSGINVPLLYPDANTGNIIPNLSFGGVPTGTPLLAGTFLSQFTLPYANQNPVIDVTDNINKIYGTHAVKAGIFFENAVKTQSPYGDTAGSLSFSRDALNPGDTNWAWSNALLGNFDTFTQLSKNEIPNYEYRNIEWYVQDSWKVNSKLTVNYGLRMELLPPIFEQNNLIAGFVPSLYSTANQVVLYQPTLVGNQRLALNPITGQTLPAGFIGGIVPGVGDPNNGNIAAGQNGYPRGLTKNRGVQWGPRIGMAYGLNNKTVLRVGGGVFYERVQGGPAYYQIENPPQMRESELIYGNVSNIGSTGQNLFPAAASGISPDGHIPTVYNYSGGVQRELPFGLLLDVSYVGSLTRHLVTLAPFNDTPFGSAWLPQNQDPTLGPPQYNGTTTLPANLYRPYLGYLGPTTSNISNQGYITTFGGTANYNALQVAVNHRVGHGLQMGMQYSWSKALGTGSCTSGGSCGVLPDNWRQSSYGPLSFDRTQTLTLNYIYSIPSGIRNGSFLDNEFGKLLLDGWQFSGLTSLSSGAPVTPTYSITNVSATLLNEETTGSVDVAPRVVLTCNPNLSWGARSITEFVDDSCFAPASKGSLGYDSGIGRLRGPGLDNWDMSIFKNIRWGKESVQRIQLRLEAFNALNHTEWATFNSNIQFNTAGQIVNLPAALGGGGGRFGFGALNSVRANSQRIVQIAAKFFF